MWVATGARPHLRARMEAGTICRLAGCIALLHASPLILALADLPQVAAGLYIACRPE